VTTLRAVVGVVLLSVGIGLTAAPEIGGLVAVGFVLFVIGVAFAASVIVDVLGVE
jgi:hypothetical protein